MNRARVRRSGSSPWAGKSFSYTKGSIQPCSTVMRQMNPGSYLLRPEQELEQDFPVRLGLFPERHIQGAACSLPQPHQTLGVQKGTRPVLPANLLILLGSPSPWEQPPQSSCPRPIGLLFGLLLFPWHLMKGQGLSILPP